MSASQWTEAEWSATVRYAEEHDGEFREPAALPLSDADIDALARRHEVERAYAASINWAVERIMGRNTP